MSTKMDTCGNFSSSKEESKCFVTLVHIRDESVLCAALNDAKKEFLSCNANQENGSEVQDDQLNFEARQSIYHLLRLLCINEEQRSNILRDINDNNYNFPPTFLSNLKDVCEKLRQNGYKKCNTFIPQYKSCAWFVDVDLSSSYAAKLLECSIGLTFAVAYPTIRVDKSEGDVTSKSVHLTEKQYI